MQSFLNGEKNMKTLKFEYQNYKGEREIREVEPKSLKFGLTANISKPEWLLEAKDIKKNEECLFVLKNVHRMIDEKVQRFFCVTVYVMHEESFLMLLNRKLGCWVPPGGKVDRHETPDEAALRECLEETGINIELKGKKTDVDGGLMIPYGIQLNVIDPEKRDHIDIIYLGEPLSKQSLKISDREASDIGWFTIEEVLKLNTFSSVKQWCNFFHCIKFK
jgi:8-oxo-dGTP pyrophosphatase MutT (NUDIX family)